MINFSDVSGDKVDYKKYLDKDTGAVDYNTYFKDTSQSIAAPTAGTVNLDLNKAPSVTSKYRNITINTDSNRSKKGKEAIHKLVSSNMNRLRDMYKTAKVKMKGK